MCRGIREEHRSCTVHPHNRTWIHLRELRHLGEFLFNCLLIGCHQRDTLCVGRSNQMYLRDNSGTGNNSVAKIRYSMVEWQEGPVQSAGKPQPSLLNAKQ
jgi:hypothetical protein